jgi:agmatinase
MMNLEGLKTWGGLAGATLEEADVVVAGIPYDGSAVYRKGAALAPSRIRGLSPVMPPVTEDGRTLDGLKVHDLGDIDAGTEIESGWIKVADALAAIPAEALLTVLGGDHCTAIGTLAAQARRHGDISVLWVDAHPDLCDFSRGGRWTCGCAMRRALEVSNIGPARVVIVGGRDYDPEELEFIRSRGMQLVSAHTLSTDENAGRQVAEALEGKKVHVSFDIDVLDPAFAPGTEIPSAGGLTTRQALELLATATKKAKLVGFDIVEVAPPFDNGDITSLAALKLIFEVWGLYWHGNR